MTMYVIANKNCEQLETTVFPSEGSEAVAVFTDSARAESYIKEAGWEKEQVAAGLETIDFMEWLIKCHRDGIKYLVTDPSRSAHESGLKLNTLSIEAHLEHAGEHIHLIANPDF